MTEIELVNRSNRSEFIGCKYKIALLPYCLREKLSDYKAEPDDIDYVCRGCSKTCYINLIITSFKAVIEKNITFMHP